VGADNLFCNETLLTPRDRSLVPGWFSDNEYPASKRWLTQLPNLQEYLRQQAVGDNAFSRKRPPRIYVIQSSAAATLAYLVETQIHKGELLVNTAEVRVLIRFWLRDWAIQGFIASYCRRELRYPAFKRGFLVAFGGL